MRPYRWLLFVLLVATTDGLDGDVISATPVQATIKVSHTVFDLPERCQTGYVLVNGKCERTVTLQTGTRPGSADSQPAPMSEKLFEEAVNATNGSQTTQPIGKSAQRTMCPEGSRFKFGMCLTPLFVRLVTLPKHCPAGYVLIEDSCRNIKGTRP
ncbi:uncharacterized protein LOC124605855 isoform X2 [Schistocerca americana]|uniref:uncharacterized protein LOC124605855 isoform X2 n=1 Tax=Schistocerca americana TaxID=7009 RepID=UPI001F4FAB84|nr:uncharacterized protein LOC124605855 isoform X2 [Schistocerca americana]